VTEVTRPEHRARPDASPESIVLVGSVCTGFSHYPQTCSLLSRLEPTNVDSRHARSHQTNLIMFPYHNSPPTTKTITLRVHPTDPLAFPLSIPRARHNKRSPTRHPSLHPSSCTHPNP